MSVKEEKVPFALGNVIRAEYYDDTWETFSYDKNGSLIETENEHVTVKLERELIWTSDKGMAK